MNALTLSQITENVRVIRAITFSSYALLMWDFLLTLDDEMTYIWECPPSVVKCLFIGNRYVNLLLQPINISQVAGVLPLDTKEACLAFSWGLTLAQVWSYASVHALVLLRIWILHGRTRKITVALIVMLILYACPCIAALAYLMSAIDFGRNLAVAGKCGARLASLSWIIWVIECALEICLLGLMVYKLRQLKSTVDSHISSLVRNLYRHAIIFFLANALCDVMNVIAWTVFLKTPFFEFPNSLPITLINITGQRLAIDLRRLHIRKEVTQSEISREVEIQMAAFDSSPAVP